MDANFVDISTSLMLRMHMLTKWCLRSRSRDVSTIDEREPTQVAWGCRPYRWYKYSRS